MWESSPPSNLSLIWSGHGGLCRRERIWQGSMRFRQPTELDTPEHLV